MDTTAAYPDLAAPMLHLDIGSLGLDHLIGAEGAGYAPYRLVKQHIARGRLKAIQNARKFTYPVCAVYPETRDEEAFEPILQGLRSIAKRAGQSKAS